MKKIVRFFTVALALVFTLTIAACKDKVNVTAQDFVKLLNLPQDRTEVGADFTVPSTLTQSGVTVDVNWTSKNEESLKFETSEVDGSKVTTAKVTLLEEVKVAEFSANVEYNGETASKDFKVKVSRYVTPEEKLNSFYTVLEKGDTAVVTGYLAYKGEFSPSYNNFSIYIQDQTGKGGYYAYRLSGTQATYDALEVGDCITVTGKKDVYSNGAQIASGASFVESTPEVENGKYNPEATNINADVADDDKMLLNTARYVEVTGTVEEVIGYDNNGGTSQTIAKVKVGETTLDVSINGYLWETKGNETVQAISTKVKTSKIGDTVSVKGYLSRFNTSWQVAVVVADDYNVTEEGQETLESVLDATMKAIDEKLANLPTFIDSENLMESYELYVSTDTRVVVEWSIPDKTSRTVLAVTDNVLGMVEGYTLPEALTDVKVRANIKIDDETLGTNVNQWGQGELVDYVIKAKNVMTTWDKYYVAEKNTATEGVGVVYAVGWTKNKDNDLGRGMALMQSTDGAYYVMAYDVAEADWKAKFVVNHTVTAKGKKDIYNGKFEIIVDSLDDVTTGEEATAVTPTDITSMIENGESLEKLQGMYVTITGAVYSGGSLTVGKKSIALYQDKYFATYEDLVENGIYTISGYVNIYNNYQISPVKATDIVKTGDFVPDYDEIMYGTATTNTNLDEGDDKNHAALVNLDATEFKVTSIKNEASTLTASNPDGTIRLYASSTGNGSAIKVEALNGKKIAKLVVKFKSNNDKEAKLLVTGHEAVGTVQESSFEVLYTEAVSSFTFQNVSTTGAQARVTAIEITYAE